MFCFPLVDGALSLLLLCCCRLKGLVLAACICVTHTAAFLINYLDNYIRAADVSFSLKLLR